ncbi:MAG: YesL family protein [Eubacterium sp.]|nr:YesL family protein [Eubacterium sp.]
MLKYDSPIMQTIGEFTDFMVLNLLFALCCIPVFTIGAAYSARFYVGMKLVSNTDEGIVKPFFKSFVSNLKQTIPINIVAVLLIVFFGLDFHYIYVLQMSTSFYYIIGAIFVIILMILWFAFALISRYVMGTKAVLKSAMLLTISHLIRVFIAVAMALVPFILSYWFFTWFWLIWLILETVMLMPNCRFLVKTFDKIEIAQGLKPDPDKEKDDETDSIETQDDTEKVLNNNNNQNMNKSKNKSTNKTKNINKEKNKEKNKE